MRTVVDRGSYLVALPDDIIAHIGIFAGGWAVVLHAFALMTHTRRIGFLAQLSHARMNEMIFRVFAVDSVAFLKCDPLTWQYLAARQTRDDLLDGHLAVCDTIDRLVDASARSAMSTEAQTCLDAAHASLFEILATYDDQTRADTLYRILSLAHLPLVDAVVDHLVATGALHVFWREMISTGRRYACTAGLAMFLRSARRVCCFPVDEAFVDTLVEAIGFQRYFSAPLDHACSSCTNEVACRRHAYFAALMAGATRHGLLVYTDLPAATRAIVNSSQGAANPADGAAHSAIAAAMRRLLELVRVRDTFSRSWRSE